MRGVLGHDFFAGPPGRFGAGASDWAGFLAGVRRWSGAAVFLPAAMAVAQTRPRKPQTFLRHRAFRHGDTGHAVFLRGAEAAGRRTRDYHCAGADSDLYPVVDARNRPPGAMAHGWHSDGVHRHCPAGGTRQQFARPFDDDLADTAAGRFGFLYAGKRLCGHVYPAKFRYDGVADQRIDARGGHAWAGGLC